MGIVVNYSYMYIKCMCDFFLFEGCKRKLWYVDFCRWFYNMKGQGIFISVFLKYVFNFILFLGGGG